MFSFVALTRNKSKRTIAKWIIHHKILFIVEYCTWIYSNRSNITLYIQRFVAIVPHCQCHRGCSYTTRNCRLYLKDMRFFYLPFYSKAASINWSIHSRRCWEEAIKLMEMSTMPTWIVFTHALTLSNDGRRAASDNCHTYRVSEPKKVFDAR